MYSKQLKRKWRYSNFPPGFSYIEMVEPFFLRLINIYSADVHTRSADR